MNSKTKNVVLTCLALVVYIGFMVGMGFILNLFWEMDHSTTLIYWITKGIVCLMVVVFSILMLFSKTDKGTGAVQLFFSVALSCLPLVLRTICLIPTVGFYIALVLAFVLICLFLIAMISIAGYSSGSKAKKI